MPSENLESDDKPPYLSFTTLKNFLDRWGDGAIPPRIDKSTLDTYSGATQMQLMNALRQMAFIDQSDQVLPALRAAATDEGARKAHLDQWARQMFATQLALAEQNATSQMLYETFAAYGYSGSTLRKAVVFYLVLVDYLGLPNSEYFRPPKQSATPTSRRRTTRRASGPVVMEEAPTPTPARPAPSVRGETTTVRIDDLATITITVDAQWMKLPVETITSMREAIAALEALDTVGADDRTDDAVAL